MKFSKREVRGVTILEPKGKITIGAGDVALRGALDEIIQDDPSKIILDLKDSSRGTLRPASIRYIERVVTNRSTPANRQLGSL